ncbi:hypothetical protein ACMGE9_12380 [Macrococcus sp. EM39E]|uniref:hypothetical protein n=1 Tax=Macrococcus animalis TaxID=3395467 RepID=UPI0039BE5A2B
MNNTFTYPKSFSEIYSSTITKPFVTKPIFNTTSIQSRLFTPKQPTFFNASNQMKRIKPFSQSDLSVFGLSSNLRKEMSTIKPFGNLHKELTSSLSSRLKEINSSYSKQLSSITNISSNWITQANKVFSPVNHALKYYEENKEEIDRTLELFESYAKEYPVEAEEMSVVDFLDFVDEKEAQKRFVEAFKTVFVPAPTYTVPTSYQLIEQFNGSISNQLSQLNYFIELSLSTNDLINLKLITYAIFQHLAGNYINDKSGYPHMSLIIQIIIIISFGKTNNKDTDK